MFHKGPSSQTKLFSPLSQRTFLTDELTLSSTNDLDELTQSFANELRHRRIYSVFLKGPSSQTNLFRLSQRTFVADELTQSFSKDLRHRLTYSVFHKGPSWQTNLLSPLSQKTFVTDELTLSSTDDLDELTQSSANDFRLSLSQRTCGVRNVMVSHCIFRQ